MKPPSGNAGDEPRVNLTIKLPPNAVTLMPGLAENPTIILNLTQSAAEFMAATPEQREQHSRETIDRLQNLANVNTFRPMKEFICDRYPTFKAIQKVLDANPSISWQHPFGKNGQPIKNRKVIHVGDWLAITKRLPGNPLDLPADVVDAVEKSLLEVRHRQEEIRKTKRRR